MESMIWSKLPPGRSVRPMLPAKSVSPAIEQLERGEVEADRALGVAGGVEDLGGIAVEADDLAVGQAFVGWRGFRGGPTPSQAACSSIISSSGRSFSFRRMGAPVSRLSLKRAADVVDVGVGDEDLLELEAELGETAVDAADLVAGIDDDGLAGLLRRRGWCSCSASGPTGKVSRIMDSF